ncbi:MAG TPA: SH3 domain-containing protein [Stellaceae bacterium]|nr:SH3 domain-containing protein [Stellaceae bacterium]
MRCFSRGWPTVLRLPWWLAILTLLHGLAHDAGASEKAQPLPRFVSLREGEVNLRAGPGERYPIDWVLTEKDRPVELLQEFDVWRKIRDAEGSEGWVHERMISVARTVQVAGEIRTLHLDPDPASPAVARAEPGVVARLLDCRGSWCHVDAQGIKGWLQRDQVWGVYAAEPVP